MHKKSTDTVDRTLANPVRLGAVQVENRYAGGQQLTNRYRMGDAAAMDLAVDEVRAVRTAGRAASTR